MPLGWMGWNQRVLMPMLRREARLTRPLLVLDRDSSVERWAKEGPVALTLKTLISYTLMLRASFGATVIAWSRPLNQVQVFCPVIL